MNHIRVMAAPLFALLLGACAQDDLGTSSQHLDECPDPNHPAVHYIADSDQNPAVCYAMLFTCDHDQELFSDECGCGCIDQPNICPDPNDPAVHYIADSDQNPAVCYAMLFTCDHDQELFSDECGCGCIDQ